MRENKRDEHKRECGDDSYTKRCEEGNVGVSEAGKGEGKEIDEDCGSVV